MWGIRLVISRKLGSSVIIEVWADVVCPWCFIGKRRLERAIAALPGLPELEVVHRVFQLDPGAISEGRLTIDVLASKYGLDAVGVQNIIRQVESAGAAEGLTMRLLETQSGNTAFAHQLILWAQQQGSGQELLDGIFSGYFENASPIFTVDELMPFVSAAGLNTEGAREVIAAGSYRSAVAADLEIAAQFGATGVPFFVFDRRFGISEAQPFEVFVETFAKALESPLI
ncbi:MAG: DsbA family oxidoreductase [Candidatus Nanopelagicales bacterium]|nr:DsbA family oxidoreductase [Candidatus Nanopelagicales bacterium]